MKRKLFILSCAALMVAGTFYSCSKDQPTADEQNNTILITAADRAVADRILEFRRKLNFKKTNPTLKSSEIIAIDDARFDVETSFNAFFAFPDEKYLNTIHKTIVVEMPVIDAANTTVDDMLALYDECFTKVLETYNNSDLDNKELIFVSLKKGEIENGKLKLNLNVVLGTKNESGYDWPFENEDNWLYGYDLGKCFGAGGNGSDAAKQIQNMINNIPTIDVMPPSGYRYVYTYA